jgi:hypothetical protein
VVDPFDDAVDHLRCVGMAIGQGSQQHVLQSGDETAPTLPVDGRKRTVLRLA